MMKHGVRRIFLYCILIVMTAWCAPAMGLPTLQLDISGGFYNPDEGKPGYDSSYDPETIVANSASFTLYALLQDPSYLSDTFFIAAALWPRSDTTGTRA